MPKDSWGGRHMRRAREEGGRIFFMLAMCDPFKGNEAGSIWMEVGKASCVTDGTPRT